MTCPDCGCGPEPQRYTHIIKRDSGYIAGWFTQADADSGRLDDSVAECNRLVPGDPAHSERIPEWPVCEQHGQAVPCRECEDAPSEPDPYTAGVVGAPLPDVHARRAEVAQLRDGP